MTGSEPAFREGLQNLIDDYPAELLRSAWISTVPEYRGRRACYRLEFSDGTVVKGRQLDDADAVGRLLRLRPAVAELPLAPLIAHCQDALLEHWVPGHALETSSIGASDTRRAGDLLGRIATATAPAEHNATGNWPTDFQLQVVEQHLGALVDASVIHGPDATALLQTAAGNAPATARAGIVHWDVCPENLVANDNGLWLIDNELLDTGFPDLDLARSWYRWENMDQQAFLEGYEEHRSADDFFHHQPFWAINVLVRALLYRHSVDAATPELVSELVSLGRDRRRCWRAPASANAGLGPVRLAFI